MPGEGPVESRRTPACPDGRALLLLGKVGATCLRGSQVSGEGAGSPGAGPASRETGEAMEDPPFPPLQVPLWVRAWAVLRKLGLSSFLGKTESILLISQGLRE